MDKWTSVPVMMRSIRLSVVKIAGILILLSLLGRDLPSAFGFAIGALLSLWQFGRLAHAANRSLAMHKAQAQVYVTSRYVLRYLVVGSVLGFVYFTENINFFATVVGLLLVKLVIIIQALRQAVREGGIAYLRQMMQRVRKGGE
jgi:hypothetical protein